MLGSLSSPDFYDTIAAEVRHELRIERSRFTGIAFAVNSEERFFERLEAIRREYFDATHRCWAFRLAEEGSVRARSSDAGEPSGTAGKPILSALEGASLADAAVVVVRDFGGVKLGTGGLSRAYRQCAVETLERTPRERRFLYDTLVAEVPFESMSAVYRLVAAPDVILAAEEFGEVNRFTLRVRRSLVAAIEREMIEKRLVVRRAR